MLIPVLGVGWVLFCLFDLIRAKQVRYLPKWGWAILCCGIGLTVPFGGILYLWVEGFATRSRLVPASRRASAPASGSF